MIASIPTSTRITLRTLIAFSLIVLGFLVLLPLPTAHATEKKIFGDVTVGPGGTSDSVSTVRGDIEVRGKVGGDVKSDFGDIEVYAPVGGSVEADFGDVYINDRVGGDLRVKHGEVDAGSGARVGGDFYCPGCTMDEFSKAQVSGEMRFGMNPGSDGSSGEAGVLGLVGWFFATLVFVAISVLAAVLVPRPVESSAQKIEESVGRSLLVGLASVPAALLLAVVLGVSIVGIPLLLLAAPVYLAFVFFGAVVAAYFIGRRILFATGGYHGGRALAATIGALILAATYLIPFLGSLILYALALLGAGGAILALLSRRRTPTYSSYETYVGDRRV
ncbi:hypothetical protein BH24ACT21_BH24ACT21_10260 [soil metagenome]|jgi:cytoskeletal protein CcmA (bactofilin family)